MKRYSFIFLDIDGTIFDFKISQKICVKKAGASFGLAVSDAQIEGYSRINEACWTDFEKGLITSEQLRVKRFARFFKEYHINNIDPADFNREYLKMLSCDSVLYDGAADFVKGLKGKGYKIAVVTNGIKENQYARMKKSPIHSYIDAMVVSEEAQAPKPASPIFELAQERLKAGPKEEGVMIGDSLSADILGGINYGMDTIWYNPQKKINTTDIIPTYEAKSYSEILKIL